MCFNDGSIWSENLNWVNHSSEMWAFKVHIKIAFSNFDPSWNQTDLWTLIFKFMLWYSLSGTWRLVFIQTMSHLQSVIAVQRKHTLKIHVMFLFLLSTCIYFLGRQFSTAYLKFTKLQHVFLWFSLQNHYRVTDEAFLAKTLKFGPSTFLRMCSLLLKERTFVFLFANWQNKT